MNRKERRKQGVKQKTPTYNLSKDQIEAVKQKAVMEASKQAFILMLGIPLIVMRDEFGFGKKRLERFIDRAIDQYDSFDKGYITLDDLINTIFEETGVEVKTKFE